jgi:hypothetical protein
VGLVVAAVVLQLSNMVLMVVEAVIQLEGLGVVEPM